MKMSRRAQRMERTYRRHKSSTQLNLVSLMDIFTILVFFLLINTSEVEVLPSTKAIRLPESSAQERPREAVTVMVTGTDILVMGRKVAEVAAALASEEPHIPALQERLERLAANRRLPQQAGGPLPEVNILADKQTPYRLLRKIMLSCTRAHYGQVSLAVLQKSESGAGG